MRDTEPEVDHAADGPGGRVADGVAGGVRGEAAPGDTARGGTDACAFIHDLALRDVPGDALHMARRCLVDTLAVWAAGCATVPGRIARDHAAKRYPGALSLAFDGRPCNPVGFAFAGAAAIDSVDCHDGHQMGKGHASAALVPALFAELGAGHARSLDAVLVDLIAGYEIAVRSALSLHATAPDYHSSGAWNTLGCAAIGARLRGLPVEETRHALGIAEYYGPRAQMMRCIDHPTMVKDSSSWGALVGVSATDLAEDGFTGAPAITCEAPEVAAFWTDLGQHWRILETNFKAYPVCRWAHPAIECVSALLDRHEIDLSQIAEIAVTTFHEATRLNTRRPVDSDAAQYCLPLVVSLRMLNGNILPEHLEPGHFDRPEVWSLVDKVTFAEGAEHNAAFPERRLGDVTIRMTDGRLLDSGTFDARGNYDAPLPDSEILDKLNSYAGPVLGKDGAGRIASILSAPADAPDTAELIALLTRQS